MARAAVVFVAVTLLAPGCAGSKASQPGSQSTTARLLGKVMDRKCTSVSGAFRACTVFHVNGEESRIERREGSRWSALVTPERAPYPGHGWWERVLPDPRGRTLLAEWSGECEVPFTYLITAGAPTPRRVFRPEPAVPLGWTQGGLARVKLLEPVASTKTRPGVYLLTPRGRVVRLEQRLQRSLGC